MLQTLQLLEEEGRPLDDLLRWPASQPRELVDVESSALHLGFLLITEKHLLERVRWGAPHVSPASMDTHLCSVEPGMCGLPVYPTSTVSSLMRSSFRVALQRLFSHLADPLAFHQEEPDGARV